MEMNVSFDLFLKTGPPTIILKPDIPKFTIITANEAYLKATDAKLEDLVGRGFLDAFPENPLDPVTKNVHALRESITEAVLTKKQHVLPSQKYDIPIWGTDQFNTHYWKATNSPIVNNAGVVECVVHVTLDITSAVESAQKERLAFEVAEAKRIVTERMEEQLRLAIASADMGTWYINTETREFIPSLRLKELFGYQQNESMTVENATRQIPEEYRHQVENAVDSAISKGDAFDIEYPVIGYHDKKLRWVRATGKCFPAEQGKPMHFSGTILDITDRKIEEQRKDDFISVASHELKTPLTSLRASLQLLNKLKENPSAKMLPRLIEQANKSMDKIGSLVDDLLNASRLNQGQLHIQKKEVTLGTVIDDCCHHVRTIGDYTVITDGDLSLRVYADPERIDQVVINFVNNAIKYAPQSKEIRIHIEQTGDRAKVSVIDKGPGIAPEKLPFLFDRYYRVDTTGVQYSGLGLGLYICSEIIKKHGGEIGVDSEFGKGSTFWFTLPLHA
jgi:PAS domain S-box-containing protein